MDELRCIAVLLHLAVDSTGERQIVRIADFVCGHDARAHRAERVHRLAEQPLATVLPQLPIPGAYVVCHREAEDVLFRRFGVQVFATLANHHGQLHFPVQLLYGNSRVT